MIEYLKGDATEPSFSGGDVHLIIHVCNNEVKWSRGFVLALSKKWKEPEQTYRERKQRVLGSIQVVPVTDKEFYGIPTLQVVNMIAQDGIYKDFSGRNPIRYWALSKCFKEIQKRYHHVGYRTVIHMPRIGCGLAGGHWDEVEYLIEEILEPHFLIKVYDLI